MPAPAVKRILRDTSYALRWGLQDFWALDEASGSAVDAISSTNTLAATNAPTANPGRNFGTARQFTSASSQYLSIADNAALSGINGDFWIAAWVYLDALTADVTIASKYESTGNQREWRLMYSTGLGYFIFDVSTDGITPVTAATGVAVTATTWHFLFCTYSAASAIAALSMDGSAYGQNGLAGGAFNGTAPFMIGAQGAAGAATFMNGRIQGVAYGKSPSLGITNVRNEILNRLWNGGNGRAWPWR